MFTTSSTNFEQKIGLKVAGKGPQVTRQCNKQEEGQADQSEHLDEGHSVFGIFLHIEAKVNDGRQGTDEGTKSGGVQTVK